MRADVYLVEQGHYESRARAQAAIKAGLVEIDGEKILKPSQRICNARVVKAELEHPYVSRGALKLKHALKLFDVRPKGRVCLDIGSSTGGFTEVLIEQGAKQVYAVDVGTNQLHDRLRGHDQIISMENQDARHLRRDMFEEAPDLLVCDASFIPLSKVLPVPLKLTREAVLLIKPQFELKKSQLGKGGIVKGSNSGYIVVSRVEAWLITQGWETLGTTSSPIKGGSGNSEFLLHARRM